MRCHYDILQVPRTASDEDIKRSYRKLALKWHPDKNPDSIEEATKFFPLLQQAYDTLMDPQERAWYDRHRDAILKGGLDEHYKDDSLILFPYFAGSCYCGYGDDDKGFYAVYNHVFETIIQEDADFQQEKSIVGKIPRFGDSHSAYDTVVGPFYGHWQSYCTSKSYVWLDEHDILHAPNRRVLRIMEKENKKIRDSARKERNEEVRTLVEFVRKRDKRVLAYRKWLEEQRHEQLAKVEAQRISQKLKNMQAAKEYADADWHNVSGREDDLKDIESHLDKYYKENESAVDEPENTEKFIACDIGDVENMDELLYCVACEKSFKNSNSFQNHERSKRHVDNVNLLKIQLTAEELALLRLDSETSRPNRSGDKRPNKKSRRRDFRSPSGTLTSPSDEELFVEASSAMNLEKKLDEKSPEAEELVADESKAGCDLGHIKTGSENNLHVKCENFRTAQPKEAHCSSCGQNFISRNKLFDHLKESGHAALKHQPIDVSRDKKKRRQKK